MYSPDLCTEYELETCLYLTKVFVSYKDEYYFFLHLLRDADSNLLKTKEKDFNW